MLPILWLYLKVHAIENSENQCSAIFHTICKYITEIKVRLHDIMNGEDFYTYRDTYLT